MVKHEDQINNMAKNGLKKWFAQKWVDIGSKRKDGSFAKCGRSKQKKLMQNVSIQNVSLLQKQDQCQKDKEDLPVSKKRAVAQGVGGKPTNVKTFTKRTKAAKGYAAGYMGKSIKGDYGGVDII